MGTATVPSGPAPAGRAITGDRPATPVSALRSVARSVAVTGRLLRRGQLAQPDDHVGTELCFEDGSSGLVYRETVRRGTGTEDPAVLVVCFRLRLVRGRGHALFRAESLLNTPLFAGFPGFVSKLWLAHDRTGLYRGFYQWDGPRHAEAYARALWWVLAVVSVPGSIRYVVIPGLRRDDVLEDPSLLAELTPAGGREWWRLRRVEPAR